MVNPNIKKRILDALEALLLKGEPSTTDNVRRKAGTGANDTVTVMREWRLAQSVNPASVADAVPPAVSKAVAALVSEIWGDLQTRAAASLREARAAWDIEKTAALTEVDELAAALDRQTAETNAMEIRSAAAEAVLAAATSQVEHDASATRQQIAALTNTARDAVTREQVTAKLADDLRAGMTAAQDAAAATRVELETERRQGVKDRAKIEVLATELATLKAQANSRDREQDEQTVRLKRAESDFAAATASQAKAREEAAELRGRSEAQQTQIETLMLALKERDAGTSAPPKGKK